MSKPDLDKVNAKIVAKSLTKFDLSTEGSLADQVARLKEYQNGKYGIKGDLAGCTECGGDSNYEEACCFCGDATVEDAEATTPEVKPAKTSKKAVKKTAKKAAKTSKKAAKTSKKASKKTAKVEEVVEEAPPAEIQTVDMLDSEIAAIAEAEREGGRSIYLIGRHLLNIKERNLYTLREKNGEVAYKTWGQFIKSEMKMARSYAHKVMATAAEFTEEHHTQIGVKKLFTLLSVAPEARPKLMGQAESGASSREIDNEISRLGNSERAPKSPKAGPGRNAPTKSEKLTVLLDKPERILSFMDGENIAEDFEDGCTATEITPNGVRITYMLVIEAGKYTLRISSKKED